MDPAGTKYLWLCLFSLVGFKSIPNLVLGFGQDGHVELEIALDDHCGKGIQSAKPDFSALNPEGENHCGECSDVPLCSDFARTASYEAVAAFTSRAELHSVIPFILAYPFLARMLGKPRILPPPTPPLILASIRTVRLLV